MSICYSNPCKHLPLFHLIRHSPPLDHFSFFFFYCAHDHRNLHSFPTRRSSDLSRDHLEPGAWLDIAQCSGSIVEMRSEEHTSELQSLRHLVCRLLLEKKKKNKVLKQCTEDEAKY